MRIHTDARLSDEVREGLAGLSRFLGCFTLRLCVLKHALFEKSADQLG